MKFRFRKFYPKGAALVMVLFVIAVMSVLLIALVTLVRREHRSTYAFGDAAEVRLLSEWPTNLVMSQIREATDSRGGKRTWASQPGMIRTYGTRTDPDTGRAALDAAYKLYSAKKMIEEVGFDPDVDLPDANWHKQPAHYVDLNEPVMVDEDGDIYAEFPIIHKNAVRDAEYNGFDFETISGADEEQPIPMPVRWLYLLEDGSFTIPDDAGGESSVATFSGDNKPTGDNPIVGRIAFWTDDESCKVNINTASQGEYWEMPRGNTHWDATHYADRQPLKNEFQKYPGHPATTSLGPILWYYLKEGEQDEPFKDTYYKLAPFIGKPEYKTITDNLGTRKVVDGSTPPVKLDSDRLYASIDEFVFQATSLDGDKNREFNHELINRKMLEEVKFVLTAHSRSPEVNLQDRPRVSIWPIQKDSGDRNVTDKLFAFCSETNQKGKRLPYYFQRLTTHDLDDPDNGGGSSQSPFDDYEKISRNKELYSYLQYLTDQDIPGFGKKFINKYPGDRDQILTEIIDYCRSGLNTMAMGLPTENDNRGFFYTPSRQVPGVGISYGEGQVIPLKIKDTMGFGRSATITEAALVLYASKYEDTPERKLNSGAFKSGYRATEVKGFLILEFFTPSTGLPTWSQHTLLEIVGMDQWKLDGSSLNFPANGKLLLNTMNGWVGGGHACAHLSLKLPFYHGRTNPPQHRDMDSQDPETGYAWHSVSPVTVQPEKETLKFTGGPIKIYIKDPKKNEVVQEISMSFRDTEIPTPFAYVDPSTAATTKPQEHETDLNKRIRKGDANSLHDHLIRPGDVARSMEVRRDLEVNGEKLPGGDLRLYSATPKIPESWFKEGGELDADGNPAQYYDPQNRFAIGLRDSVFGWYYQGSFNVLTFRESGLDATEGSSGNYHPYYRISNYRTAGSLVEGTRGYSFGGTDITPIYRDAHPIAARGQVAAFRRDGRPGDWDQGVGSNEDGPFINKPDETNSTSLYWDWGGFYHAGGYYQRGNFNTDPDGNNHSPNRQISSAVNFGSLPTGVKSLRPWETLLFCPNPPGRQTPSTGQPTSEDHIGFAFPRDHLLLDLFWMPVTEPYAISEPFSTAGKVNMNYDIMPFRYIKRQTAVRAALQRLEIMAVPEISMARNPHGCIKGGRDQAYNQSVRYQVRVNDTNGTLKAFENRFAEGDIFRSASEICEIFLVPRERDNAANPYPTRSVPVKYENMTEWWNGKPGDSYNVRKYTPRATGDNVREAPYGHIYPRLTTQSNVYQVHYRCQLLKKAKRAEPDVWDEEMSSVAGEFRGSTLIERYIDPNDPDIPDYTVGNLKASQETLSQYYRFRVIGKRQFSP